MRKDRYGKLVRGWDWRTTPERLEKAEKYANWLDVSKTSFLELCIDKMSNLIYLTEDNAGGLMIGNPIAGWWDVTALAAESNFADDATGIIAGDTRDWTVEHYESNTCTNIVATFDGIIAIEGKYGRAAQAYLRRSNEEFEAQ